jgi:50S ribosomal protein L16 3-hydroxylase
VSRTQKHSENGPLTHLGEMPIEQFLADYWQKKPLLVRQAFPGFQSPVSPEELAGFALEEGVESRLIRESPNKDPLHSDWNLQQGPLSDTAFADLPERHWSLLVQAVDQLVPEVGSLLNRFRFLPNWRLDDIMVSYAADQGSVGPHFDYYDVFLLQGEGQRRWRLGQHCDSGTAMRTDTAMNLLAEFDTEAEYLLEPGDLLYVPPQLAHWGIAQGPCITYSIGFRAPSYSELLQDFSDEIASRLTPDQRYGDSGSTRQFHPGEISTDAVARVQDILLRLTQNKELIAHWLGSYGTQAKRETAELDDPLVPDADMNSASAVLKLRVRSAYVAQPDAPDQAMLYLGGVGHDCSLALAQALSAYEAVTIRDFPAPNDQALLAELVSNGWLYCLD